MAKDKEVRFRGHTLIEAIGLPKCLFRAIVLWLFYKQEVGLEAMTGKNEAEDREAFNDLIGVQRPADSSVTYDGSVSK